MDVGEYVQRERDPWGLKRIGIDERRASLLRAHLSRKGAVLDVGCAFGIYTRFLASLGNRSVGVDMSERMVSEAKRRCPSCRVVKADATHLPFRDETFDAVLLMGTLIYIDRKAQALQEIRRVMKKNAVLCIIDRNRHSPWHALIAAVRRETAIDKREDFLASKQLTALLRDAGFRLRTMSGDLVALPVLSQSRVTRRLFWFLGERMPLAAAFLVAIAEKS